MHIAVAPVPASNQTAAPADLDSLRRASWLKSAYLDPVWTVSDSHDATRTKNIDFRMRLADGRLLTEALDLYTTVKEYAFWLRDARFSRIDDAQTHATLVRNLMGHAHGLTRRNIWTFALVQPFELEQIVEECRFGLDGLLHASERVDAHLQKLAAENDLRPQTFGGLPQYIVPATGKPTSFVHVERLIAECNLPTSACRLPGVKFLIERAAMAHGLRRPHGNPDAELRPLVNVTAQSMQRWLDPFEQLYAMRRHIEGDSLSFRPFPQGAARIAAVKGVGAARTPIPPPQLVLQLLARAFDWIVAHGDSAAVKRMNTTDALQLATACWIVIAAFSARRDEEIDELADGCLNGSDAAGWWLHVYIEKTLQRKEWIPVPNVVARAVNALTLLSAEARAETGLADLFQWLRGPGDIVNFDAGSNLDAFAQIVQLPPHHPSGGTPAAWHWHPHQFRRFFAVLFFYRFEGATVEVLSHHLRHFSLEMTRRYVTKDPEVAALWIDVEWGYMGHVARSIATGARVVSGSAGERLKRAAQRLIDIFRRKLQIVSPERVGASLSMLMQRDGMILTPKSWVICSCPDTRNAAEVAACRKQTQAASNAVGPDFANAGPTVCPGCPHGIIDQSTKPYVDAEVNHLEAVVASSCRGGTLFGALEGARLVEIREARDSKYGAATPIERAAVDIEAAE